MEYAGAPGEAFITLGPVTQAMFGDLGYKVVVGGASNPCKPNPCQNSGLQGPGRSWIAHFSLPVRWAPAGRPRFVRHQTLA